MKWKHNQYCIQHGSGHDRTYPDSKIHGANMGPIWGRQDPGGSHVGPMNLAICVSLQQKCSWLQFNPKPISCWNQTFNWLTYKETFFREVVEYMCLLSDGPTCPACDRSWIGPSGCQVASVRIIIEYFPYPIWSYSSELHSDSSWKIYFFTVSLHSPDGRQFVCCQGYARDCQQCWESGGNSLRLHEATMHCSWSRMLGSLLFLICI